MKSLRLCFIFILLFLPALLPAQWERCNGGTFGGISCLCQQGTTLFGGFSDHNGPTIMASTDGGAHWSFSSNGVPHENITLLSSTDSTLYVGTIGLFASTDHGGNWHPAGMSGIYIRVLSMNKQHKFVTTGIPGYTGPVYRSNIGDTNWVKSDSTLKNPQISALLATDGVIYLGTQEGGNPDGGPWYYGSVYRSTDEGDHWVRSDSGITSKQVIGLAIVDSVVIGATGKNSIVVSTNGGTSWKESAISQGTFNSFMVIGSTIYSCTSKGVYASLDHGVTWSAVPNLSGNVQAFIAQDGDFVAGVNGWDVRHSSDAGGSWKTLNTMRID